MQATIELYPKYLVQKYFAEVHGISRQTFDYHLEKGRYPAPSHQLGRDSELMYDDDDVKAILKYWEGRRYYARTPAKVS